MAPVMIAEPLSQTHVDDIQDPGVPGEVINCIVNEDSRNALDSTQASSTTQDTPEEQIVPNFALHEAVLHGACDVMIGKLTKFMTEASTSQIACQSAIFDFLKDWVAKQVAANEHAQYQLSSTLDNCQKHGFGMLGAPYTGTICAVSPHGFPLSITIAQRDQDALSHALGEMMTTLSGFGCTPPQV